MGGVAPKGFVCFAATSTDGPVQPAVAGMDPPARYFIVTDPAELRRQPDLERVLARYRLVVSDPRFSVWAL